MSIASRGGTIVVEPRRDEPYIPGVVVIDDIYVGALLRALITFRAAFVNYLQAFMTGFYLQHIHNTGGRWSFHCPSGRKSSERWNLAIVKPNIPTEITPPRIGNQGVLALAKATVAHGQERNRNARPKLTNTDQTYPSWLRECAK
jgi:hypothetical protein